MANEKFDLIISNATCLLPSPSSPFGLKSSVIDVGVYQGKITSIGQLNNKPSVRKISANGLHLIPGVIDSQVHFRDPGLTHKEDIATGSLAAIHGGVTGFFEMPNTLPPTTDAEQLSEKLHLAKTKSWANYAFYIGATKENIPHLAQLERLPGAVGVKVFMGSSTGNLLVEDDDHLEQILLNTHRRIAIHAEDETLLQAQKEIAIKSAHPRAHPLWRNENSALQATSRIVALTRKTRRRIHLLHITTREELELLKNEKEFVSIECLPQHLTLSAPECYERLGSKAQMNPPIRDSKHQDALWRAIQTGLIDIIGSDHAPHTLEEKSLPYPQSPAGMPGVQTLLPIMLNHVNRGRLSLERLVELIVLNPVRLFGIHARGQINIGFCADLTLIDLKKEQTITHNLMKSRCGWTPYEGMKVTGWPQATVVNGNLVMFEGETLNSPDAHSYTFPH